MAPFGAYRDYECNFFAYICKNGVKISEEKVADI